MIENAYVQAITCRGRHVGYGVYAKRKFPDGMVQGRCLHVFRVDGKLANATTLEVALHLANTCRDDFNQRIK
jgi:hypothetical protein